jgi:hypothetical protein
MKREVFDGFGPQPFTSHFITYVDNYKMVLDS